MPAIVVTGVPGVGKTTVMEQAAEESDLEVTVFGSVMLEIAKEENRAEHRDDIRKLPVVEQERLQEKAASRISDMGEVIVDTHASIRTPEGYFPGLPERVLTKLKPQAIVLIEADPDAIAKRRTEDTADRKRDLDSSEAIAEHQDLNRSFATAYAAISGAAVHIIENRQGEIDQAVKDLLPLLGQR